MKILSPAKVNLYLDIVGKRKDGYHKIETIFQTVSLYDTVEVSPAGPNGPSIALTVISQRGEKSACPPNHENIVWKAAKLFFETFNLKKSCRIVLTKNIPIQAGLGGGSSNAASTLKALSRIFLKNRSSKETKKLLRKIACRLGADVPFFLEGGCALASGIGEKIVPLPSPQKFWLVILKPEIGLSTREVYQWFDWETNRPKRLTYRSNLNKIKVLITKNKGVQDWGICIHNSFERIVLKKVPELGKAKERLLRVGSLNASLSGSGSAFFGIALSKADGERIQENLKRFYPKVWLVHSV